MQQRNRQADDPYLKLFGDAKSLLNQLKEQVRLKQVASKMGEPTGKYDYKILSAIDEASRIMAKLDLLKQRYTFDDPPTGLSNETR